jgi:hypothetical protein
MITTSYDPEADALYVRFAPKGGCTLKPSKFLIPLVWGSYPIWDRFRIRVKSGHKAKWVRSRGRPRRPTFLDAGSRFLSN